MENLRGTLEQNWRAKSQNRASVYINLNKTYKCPYCKDVRSIGYYESNETTQELYGDNRKEYFAKICDYCNGGLTDRAEVRRKQSRLPYNSKLSEFDWSIYRDSSGKILDLRGNKAYIEYFIEHYHDNKREGKGLYIFSRTKGSGKTFLASCICNELIDKYAIQTRSVRATDLLDISKSGDQNAPEEYQRNPIKALCECELLLIDDIGQKKNGYDWMNDVVFKILDERYLNKLVTIFTSNLTQEELNLESRIISRICAMTRNYRLPEYNVRQIKTQEEDERYMKNIGFVRVGET